MIEWIIGKDEQASKTRFAYVKEKTSTTPHDAHSWAWESDGSGPGASSRRSVAGAGSARSSHSSVRVPHQAYTTGEGSVAAAGHRLSGGRRSGEHGADVRAVSPHRPAVA